MVPDRFAPVLDGPRAPRRALRGRRPPAVPGGRDRPRPARRPRRPRGDIDLTTDARPAEIKAILAGWADAVWTQGERFGTIGARHGERDYEITTHRAEAYVPDSRKPEVVFADAVEADLSRRDFTVNAMALELTTDSPALIDPFGGAADLAAGTCCARRCAPRSPSATTRCACCGRPGSSPATGWSRCPSWSPR